MERRYCRRASGAGRVSQKWWIPALALVMLAAWWAAGRLQAPADIRLTPDARCDIGRRACSLPLPGGGSVALGLNPLPPKVMQPLTVDVRIDVPVRAVWVDFVGINMDMGFNRAELSPVGEGLWQGQVILPICASAEMRWEARVLMQHEGRMVEAPFAFVTRP